MVGIDEAGRGPLAGPVVVGAVARRYQRGRLTAIKDSKKLSAKQREEWNRILRKNFECRYASVSNKAIDKIGIQKAALLGVRKVLRKLSKKPDIVLLDGLLKAPSCPAGMPNRYKQKTIIKGDEKIPLISAASIIAKVARDRKMARLHKKFLKYGFDRHKGYGTKLHYKKIKKYGLSKIHRRSFCKKK